MADLAFCGLKGSLSNTPSPLKRPYLIGMQFSDWGDFYKGANFSLFHTGDRSVLLVCINTEYDL